jgi:amino acid transporter
MSRHGLFHAAAGDAHATHATPHVAVTFAAIAVLVGPLVLLASHFALLDIFGDLGTLGTLSVLFSYVLVSVAAPVYLRRRSELRPGAVVVAGVAVVAMIVAIVGTVYPVPPPPQSYIPYVFIVLLALGVSRFLYVRSRDPNMIRDIEADLAAT